MDDKMIGSLLIVESYTITYSCSHISFHLVLFECCLNGFYILFSYCVSSTRELIFQQCTYDIADNKHIPISNCISPIISENYKRQPISYNDRKENYKR